MLFTPKLTAHDKDGFSRILNRAGMLGQRVGVIPRAQCHFRQMRLNGTGREALKAAALRAQKEARAGDDRIRMMAHTDDQNVGVWSYNASQETHLRTLPESLCYIPLDEGARLITCLTGFEGQVWEGQTLVASRWWPSQPSSIQWQSFLRVAPYTFSEDLPASVSPVSVPFRSDLPLFRIDRTRIKGLASPARIGTAAALGSLAAASFLGSQYLRYSNELKSVEADKVEISQAARQTLAKRRKALATVTSLGGYTQLSDTANLISGINDVTSVMGGQDLLLRNVRLNDGSLEFRVEGEQQLPGPELVRRLEAKPSLTGVNISTDRQNTLVIKAILGSNTDTPS